MSEDKEIVTAENMRAIQKGIFQTEHKTVIKLVSDLIQQINNDILNTAHGTNLDQVKIPKNLIDVYEDKLYQNKHIIIYDLYSHLKYYYKEAGFKVSWDMISSSVSMIISWEEGQDLK